jgi:hypothetical protein
MTVGQLFRKQKRKRKRYDENNSRMKLLTNFPPKSDKYVSKQDTNSYNFTFQDGEIDSKVN